MISENEKQDHAVTCGSLMRKLNFIIIGGLVGFSLSLWKIRFSLDNFLFRVRVSLLYNTKPNFRENDTSFFYQHSLQVFWHFQKQPPKVFYEKRCS